MADEDKVEFARRMIGHWNRGEIDSLIALFADDAAMYPGADWPEQDVRSGRDSIREYMEEWRTVWESSQIDAQRFEVYGDRVVGSGSWRTRGRSSGVEGDMPFVVLLGVQDEKISSFEWFTDHDVAVAAAREP